MLMKVTPSFQCLFENNRQNRGVFSVNNNKNVNLRISGRKKRHQLCRRSPLSHSSPRARCSGQTELLHFRILDSRPELCQMPSDQLRTADEGRRRIHCWRADAKSGSFLGNLHDHLVDSKLHRGLGIRTRMESLYPTVKYDRIPRPQCIKEI
jgi:hypothetical protein